MVDHWSGVGIAFKRPGRALSEGQLSVDYRIPLFSGEVDIRYIKLILKGLNFENSTVFLGIFGYNPYFRRPNKTVNSSIWILNRFRN
jgi:hypothetical protein